MTSTQFNSFTNTVTSQYNTYVSSQLDNSKADKYMSRYTTGSMSVTREQVNTYFKNLVSILLNSYSLVIETDINTLKFMLEEPMRKFLCDNFKNLRIVHVTKIPVNPNGFGFSFTQPPNYSDGYLICSTSSGFLTYQTDYVEFSTYDMKTQSYSQLNRVSFSDMSKFKYSLDFNDYHYERPYTQSGENSQKKFSQQKRPLSDTNQTDKKESAEQVENKQSKKQQNVFGFGPVV